VKDWFWFKIVYGCIYQVLASYAMSKVADGIIAHHEMDLVKILSQLLNGAVSIRSKRNGEEWYYGRRITPKILVVSCRGQLRRSFVRPYIKSYGILVKRSFDQGRFISTDGQTADATSSQVR
jgi:hypothetical protein